MQTDSNRFSSLPSRLARGALTLGWLGLAVLGGLGLSRLAEDSSARYEYARLLLTQEARLRLEDSLAASERFVIAPSERRRFELTATAYCPLCGSEDGQPQSSALGGPVIPGHTIAVSQDLKALLGRKVYIVGLGVRFVEDLMHPRHAGRLDLCLPNKAQALAFGVKRLEMVVLD